MTRQTTLTIGALAIAALTLGATPAALAGPESGNAFREPRVPKDALAKPKVVTPALPLSVYVAQPGQQSSFVVVASDTAGASHQLKVEAKDGRVVIATDAMPDQPWLGVLYNTEDDGVRITGIVTGSPAEQAGLHVGDLMTKLDGRDIGREATSGASIMDHNPGDRVTIAVERDGKELRVPVTLGSRPASMEIDLDEDMTPFGLAGDLLGGLHELKALEALKHLPGLPCVMKPEDCGGTGFSFSFGDKPRLGVLLESMSPQLAEYFGADAGKGLLVMDIVADTPAAKAGVAAGDVLLKVGGQEVRQASDVRVGLEDVGKGETATVEVLRRGRREVLTVTLDSDPPTPGKQSFLFAAPGDWRQWADQWKDWGSQWKDWGAAFKDEWKDAYKDVCKDSQKEARGACQAEAAAQIREALERAGVAAAEAAERSSEIRERLRDQQAAAREALRESRQQRQESLEKAREQRDEERARRDGAAPRKSGEPKLMRDEPRRTTFAPNETEI